MGAVGNMGMPCSPRPASCPFFYGWVILSICSLCKVVGTAGTLRMIAFLIPSMMEDEGLGVRPARVAIHAAVPLPNCDPALVTPHTAANSPPLPPPGRLRRAGLTNAELSSVFSAGTMVGALVRAPLRR
eukprot:SAG11_NODE_3275_length_2559_cov_6.359756_2_plen_129_part_00